VTDLPRPRFNLVSVYLLRAAILAAIELLMLLPINLAALERGWSERQAGGAGLALTARSSSSA